MKSWITVGLGYGDEGKGSIVDSLVRRHHVNLVVRYCGGCQAGHNVVTDDGRHHTFSQIGAGTFVPGTYTLLSKYMLVNPLTLMNEHEALAAKGVDDALNRVFIDGRAIMVTPYHRAVNRLREISRGSRKHGSCGAGVGECVNDSLCFPDAAIHLQDLDEGPVFATKLFACAERMQREANHLDLPNTALVDQELSTWRYDRTQLLRKYADFSRACSARILSEHQVADLLTHQKHVVFEGAQGVLLDERYGEAPYHTWSTTTVRNALLMLEEAEITEKPTTIGVLRTYLTRHGAGPFRESQALTNLLQDRYNPRNPWQDGLRCGYLNLPLLQYSLRSNGPVDCLALTHLDRVVNPWLVQLYDSDALHEVPAAHFVDWVQQNLNTPVAIESRGPRPSDKTFARESAPV
jgi:adenylosuccinate synthase